MPGTSTPPAITAPSRDRPAKLRPPAARPGGRGALARYTDSGGRRREVLATPGLGGSVLVIDRDAATGCDQRLVAHLAADEPPGNAALTCRLYLERLQGEECRCRALLAEDLRAVPFHDEEHPAGAAQTTPAEGELIDAAGTSYRMEELQTGMSIPELRWRSHPGPALARPRVVSLREAIAALESYEPLLELTREGLARAPAAGVSVAVLRMELRRVLESPIVLNRRLREVALTLIDREGLTLSEVAIRCGRIKRDGCGGATGETSWLARRLGILPEGGRQSPTPWIHIDVLALIARRGLGLSPREVELH